MRTMPLHHSVTSAFRPLAAASLVLASCTVGPDFQRPQVSVPDSYRLVSPDPAATLSTVTPQPADLSRWWAAFSDPTLSSLIDRAAAANLDVKAAEARIRQARASVAISRSGLFPTLDASGSATRSRRPGRTADGKNTGVYTNLFQAGLDASWEIDVFGGVRRGVEAAQATQAAVVEDRRNVLVTLEGELAMNYADLRGAQEQLRVAFSNLQAQQRTLEITRGKFQGGLISRLDVAQAESQVATTRAAIPGLQAAVQDAVYNIGVLLAQDPASLEAELLTDSPIPLAPPVVPAGIPSELLERRPDIRRDEALLHAATADVGVAISNLYPRFSLTGSFGLSSTDLARFANIANRSFSFGPSFRWPLFQGGALRANIELNQARVEEALDAYQQTILLALRDVDSALMNYAKEQERHAALVDAVDANRRSVDMSTRLYEAGETDFLTVLTAQRSLFASEDALAASTRNLATDLIAIYKALGGGWESFEPAADEPRPQGEQQPPAR